MTYTFNRIGSLLGAPTAINGVISQIEIAMNSLVSKIDNSGNQMSVSLDMNSNRILNLPVPSYGHEPARFSDLLNVQQGVLTLLGPQASVRGGVFLSSPIANNFVTGISSNGDIQYAQPTFNNLASVSTQLFGTANTWSATQTFSASYFGSGATSSQVGGWVNTIWPGSQYSVISPSFTSSVPTGGGAGTFAARMSDTDGGGFGSIQTLRVLAYVDANPSNYPAWGLYIEGHTDPAVSGYYIGCENSLKSNWTFAAETPYSLNALNRTVLQRYSAGIGSAGPNNVSAAIDIVPNGAKFDKGIIFGDGSLDTSTNFGEAIAMAYKQGFSFYTAGGSRAWIIQSLTTAAGGTFAFQDSSIALYGAAGVSYLYAGNTGTGVVAVGPSSGDQVVIYGNLSGQNAVDIQAQGADTNIDLRLKAKGSGKVSVISNRFAVTGTLELPAPVTKTADYTVDSGASPDYSIIFNGAGSLTVTLPSAATYPGRVLRIRTIAAQTVVSASSNVVPLAGGAAGTAILAATAGKWADLQSDGSDWTIMGAN